MVNASLIVLPFILNHWLFAWCAMGCFKQVEIVDFTTWKQSNWIGYIHNMLCRSTRFCYFFCLSHCCSRRHRRHLFQSTEFPSTKSSVFSNLSNIVYVYTNIITSISDYSLSSIFVLSVFCLNRNPLERCVSEKNGIKRKTQTGKTVE